MAKKQRGADIRIVGTKKEILDILADFSAKGFVWRSNEHFYARREEPDVYSYYLENFEHAPQAATGISDTVI